MLIICWNFLRINKLIYLRENWFFQIWSLLERRQQLILFCLYTDHPFDHLSCTRIYHNTLIITVVKNNADQFA